MNILKKKSEIVEQKKVESINVNFYDTLYKKRNVFFQLIYPFLSFDQQSKANPNYQTIKFLFKNRTDNKSFNFLDYGFGHGSLLLKIPQKNGLFGCDISTEAVRNFPRVAKLLGKQVNTFTPPQLSSQETKFDIISLSHVLEHVEDDLFLLKELAGFLAPNGYVLINVPINEVWEDPKHIRKYTSLSLQNLLKNAGLTVHSIVEKDKWSAFLLINEKVEKGNIIKKIFFRSLRLLLVLLPESLFKILENMLDDKFKHQQLIVLASKHG